MIWKGFNRTTNIVLVLVLIIPIVFMFFRKYELIKKMALYGYIIIIFSFTVFFRFSNERIGINLEPFWSYKIRIWPQIIQNYLLFFPLGFLLPYNNKEIGIIKTVLIAFTISAAIEGVQYVFKCGFCEVDDIIGNTAGSIIGYLYWKGLNWFWNVEEMKRKKE